MLVSVLMANFNQARFLPEAIHSIAGQTHQDLELVFIDDGSSDASLHVAADLLERYQERFARVEILANEQNQGKIHALNRAVGEARGEAAVIVDADDFLHELFLEKLVAALVRERARSAQVAFVYSDCYLVDESGATISIGRCAEFSEQLIQTRSFIPECGLTLTSVLKSIVPMDESIRIGTKHHKWKKIVAAGHTGVWLREPLFYYRMHGENLSGIGSRVLASSEEEDSRESILSGYWPTEGQPHTG